MTIDDLTMSMIAHGYGGSAVASNTILYSNALWGDFVRFIPEIHGILGYSLATFGVLILVGTIVVYALGQIGAGRTLSLGLLLLLLTGPCVTPQFTLNAGLLTLSSILLFHLYAREKKTATLILGVLLAWCGFLIRYQQFFLVFLIALPILPWKTLFEERAPKIALLVLALAMMGATVYNKEAYHGEAWEHFKAFEASRGGFSDFGAVERLKEQPEIYQALGYTANDLDLLEHWFFVDPKIANPQAMKQMLDQLGPMPLNDRSIKNTWRGIRALFKPILLPAVLSGLFLLLLWPNRRVAASWVLCIAAVGLMGFMGRPGIMRVYIPLVFLLCLAPLLFANFQSDRKRQIASGIVLMAALINFSSYILNAQKAEHTLTEVTRAMAQWPEHLVVVWTDALPYEWIYPLIGTDSKALSYRFYRLGTFILDPNSVSFAEQEAGRGMMDLLTSEKGVDILARSMQIDLLAQYCKEHYEGTLKITQSQAYPDLRGGVTLAHYRCET